MTTSRQAVIVAAKRTAVGRAKRGALVHARPEDMGKVVIDALLQETRVDGKDVNDLLVGCAMPEGEQGMNLARMVGYYSNLPQEVPAATINRFCSSGLETISIAAARIQAGWQDIVIAGGVETMSMIPMGGNKIVGHHVLAEKNPEIYTSMGNTAEIVLERYAKEYDLTRDELDRFSYESHMKAVKALEAGKFKSQIVPLPYTAWENGKPVEKIHDTDEGPRGDTTIEALSKLKPAFKTTGAVTAGNSSQMNDAAAFVMLMTAEEAKKRKLPIMAYFRNYQVVGVDPAEMGVGPAYAIPRVIEKAGLSLKDIDLFEINEAFASQALYCVRKLGIDPAKVNPNGGAIALGHPLGCTGAKLTTQLLYEMAERKLRWGIVSMCIGGGMGAAGLFERC